jgi:hypothetical protein
LRIIGKSVQATLTESFVLPPKRGVHPMSQRIAHKIAFGPSALNDLARAFDSAWLELCAWGVEANTEQQIKRIRTSLAQRIMEYATEGEQDVGHLKEFGLQGLPHVCAHGVRLPKAVKVASLSRVAHYSAIGA